MNKSELLGGVIFLAGVVYLLCVSVAVFQIAMAWIIENFEFYTSVFYPLNWHISLQIGGGGVFVFIAILFLIGGLNDAK